MIPTCVDAVPAHMSSTLSLVCNIRFNMVFFIAIPVQTTSKVAHSLGGISVGEGMSKPGRDRRLFPHTSTRLIHQLLPAAEGYKEVAEWVHVTFECGGKFTVGAGLSTICVMNWGNI